MTRRAAATAFAAAVAAPAGAQEPVQLPELVVSGGLTPVEAEAFGRSYSVVTREEIERRQFRYVSEALRALPGVSVSRTGGLGGLTQVRIRGAEGNQTLVLIDGVDVSAPQNGEFDFGGLLADDIERIEVLRGPQSSIYGANAMGGVISITTRGAEREGLTVGARAEGGSDRTLGLHAFARGLNEVGSFSLSATRWETQGFDISGTPGGEEDGDRNATVTAQGELFAYDWLTLGGVLRYVDRRTDFDGYDFFATTRDGLVFDDDQVQKRQELLASLYARAELGRFQAEARGSYLHADDRFTDSSFDRDDTSTRMSFSVRGTVALDAPDLATADHSLTALAEIERETFQSNDPTLVFDPSQLDERSRNLVGLVGEYRGTFFDALDLQAGLRHDFNDDFEDATTWSAGVSYRVAGTGSRLHASAGRAVTNPTLFEQFGFLPGTFQGNPDLEPESGFGWDVGIEQRFWNDRGLVDLTYFRQNLEDEIAATGTTVVNQTGTSERQGIEVSAELRPADPLTLGLSYTWLDAEDPDGLVEIRRPRHALRASATLFFLQDRAQVTVAGRYVAGEEDTALGGRVEMAPYTVVDVTASYELRENLKIFGRVENAADADYEEIVGYAAPGLRAFAGIRAEW